MTVRPQVGGLSTFLDVSGLKLNFAGGTVHLLNFKHCSLIAGLEPTTSGVEAPPLRQEAAGPIISQNSWLQVLPVRATGSLPSEHVSHTGNCWLFYQEPGNKPPSRAGEEFPGSSTFHFILLSAANHCSVCSESPVWLHWNPPPAP